MGFKDNFLKPARKCSEFVGHCVECDDRMAFRCPDCDRPLCFAGLCDIGHAAVCAPDRRSRRGGRPPLSVDASRCHASGREPGGVMILSDYKPVLMIAKAPKL